MLFEQRRLCQCADTEIEREGHKRIKLTLRHLPAQPVHSPLEARKIGGQQRLRLLACDGQALANIGTSMAHADRPDFCWAQVGGETFAFIGGDERAASGRGD